MLNYQLFNMMSIEDNICPICLDVMSSARNSVTTECGHTFHCSCLMRNISQNGFNCPYCRTNMAEQPQLENVHDAENDADHPPSIALLQPRHNPHRGVDISEYNINAIAYLEPDNYQDMSHQNGNISVAGGIVAGQVMYFPSQPLQENIIQQRFRFQLLTHQRSMSRDLVEQFRN